MELQKAAKKCLPGAFKIYNRFTAKHYPIFPQKLWQQGKVGKLTSDFLANVEGYSLPPPRPEDHCDELRLVAGLVVCGGDAEGRSFHEICGKIWKAGVHRFRRR